jgi:hypothetical protein
VFFSLNWFAFDIVVVSFSRFVALSPGLTEKGRKPYSRISERSFNKLRKVRIGAQRIKLGVYEDAVGSYGHL